MVTLTDAEVEQVRHPLRLLSRFSAGPEAEKAKAALAMLDGKPREAEIPTWRFCPRCGEETNDVDPGYNPIEPGLLLNVSRSVSVVCDCANGHRWQSSWTHGPNGVVFEGRRAVNP